VDSKKLLVSFLVATLGACASAPRFPLRAPLLRDPDQQAIPTAPEEYFSPFAWDGVNQMVFRPVARFFAVDPAGPAVNVNALDEVPDSSWFENRLGRRTMTAEEVARGPCDDKVLDPSMPDGSWIIDRGKDNGANPGFRVNVPGLGKFMLKTDPETEPDRATGATAVSARVYHATGYFAPCDAVVYFRRSLLHLKPGLTVTNNQGVTRPFDERALDGMLARASHRNGLIRMVASSWLPGKTLGPYKYDGLRGDDPNDVIPHEDRRELRGAKLVAAWLNHFDSREQNTMDVFIPLDPKRKDGPGYVRHYIIDMGDSFGSMWTSDGLSRRLGYSYIFDAAQIGEDFVTFGALSRPWERARQSGTIFNYFSARDFDPETWKGEYQNPAFLRMTEGDGAWMARILARFRDELVAAAVGIAQYAPRDERYLIDTLIARRDAILRRYLSRLSPLSEVVATKRGLCATDLARQSGIVAPGLAGFRARAYRGEDFTPDARLRFARTESPLVCVELPHAELGSLPNDAVERYLVIDITNGHAKGPLRAHLYDLGPERGYYLAGVERPDTDDL
jgi:hypothetical protein